MLEVNWVQRLNWNLPGANELSTSTVAVGCNSCSVWALRRVCFILTWPALNMALIKIDLWWLRYCFSHAHIKLSHSIMYMWCHRDVICNRLWHYQQKTQQIELDMESMCKDSLFFSSDMGLFDAWSDTSNVPLNFFSNFCCQTTWCGCHGCPTYL